MLKKQGEFLKDARQKRYMSTYDIARYIDVEENIYLGWENGETEISNAY